MGIIYYAANHETKEAYELGKGSWHSITEAGDMIRTTPDLLDKIKAELRGPYWHPDLEGRDEYATEIYLALKALGDVLTLESDSSDWYPETEGFKQVGSRYRERQ